MLRRSFALVALLVAALVVAAAPVRAAAPARIVAVGDLHGDHGAWLDVLRAAMLVDERGRWTGGAAVLVQTGDVPDRGPDTLRIIRHLMQLQREAPQSGGRVVALVGNHEAMNVTGDLRYVHPGEYAAFADDRSRERRNRLYQANRTVIEAAYRAEAPAMSSEAIRGAWMKATPLGWAEHQAAWRPEGEIGRWVRSNPAVLMLGDTLFVHGGISPAYAKLSIEEINRRVAAALAARETEPASILNDPDGPLWYRGLAVRETGATGSVEDELTAVLAAYSARRMVIGHTPVLSGIPILHGGRLARIDTGMSRHYGGPLSYLEIVDGRLVPHAVPRSAGRSP